MSSKPAAVQLNYHAPAKFCHSYFHNNGHLNWRFDAFRGAVISDPKDPTNANEEAIYQWNANLRLIFRSRIVESQTTSSIPETAFRAKLSRNAAEAGLAHKEAAIATTKAVDEWLENPSVPKKRKRQVDWSSMMKNSSSSVPYVNTLDFANTKNLPHQAMNALVNFKLRPKHTDDVVWALNLFRQATGWQLMKTLEHEFHARMEMWDTYDQTQEDRFYIREMYMNAANLWQRGTLGRSSSNNEGWLLWNLHGPLMDIFKAIRHVKLRATDLKGRNNSHGDKHDLLVTHEVFPLDVVIMEAKRHKQGNPKAIDAEKVARTMAGNITRALQLIPESRRDESMGAMRSFGMINSGTKESEIIIKEET
ncbi:hypothetical protein BGX21_005104 [Mortierella sp. AD011]|nr:hypothetical protein BGX20_003741 [Mortierella sp. AD010]KAF9403347.1 hypothetical protein BGX21_005104 [Mortierella sp. AD011]